MSNRRRPANPIADVFADLSGRRLPGGCDDCTAYTVLTETLPGVIVVNVHHDDTCPAYRQMQRRTA